KVLQGCSPEDVPSAMESLKVPAENQGVDLIFIDGEHTNAQVTKDIDAVMPYLAPDGAIMLHDVVAFSMVDAVKAACTTHGLTASLLPSTNSGILLLHPQPLGETTALACRAFGHHRWSFNMLSHFRKGETILDLPPEVFGPLNPLDP
ncbi:MAG: class I SAM-dependent methyltransferase, partial [Rhodospirillaceae bacterium]